jgi:maltoporin
MSSDSSWRKTTRHGEGVSGVGCQALENREPQNTEQGIMNAEGNANLSIRNSLFDIRYLNLRKWVGVS